MDLRRLLPKWLQPVRRAPARQRQVDAETAHMALYHSPLCGYCLGVRRTIRRLDLNIELRNVTWAEAWQDELRREGGKGQVPCLRIRHPDHTEWLYESADINAYLRTRFKN